MLLLSLIVIANAQNLVTNPSFDIIQNEKATNWTYDTKCFALSDKSHEGKYSMHILSTCQAKSFTQRHIHLEKGYMYDICVYYKTLDLAHNFDFFVENIGDTYEGWYSSSSHTGTHDWTKDCRRTESVKSPNGEGEEYVFGVYISELSDDYGGEAYIDDVTVTKTTEFLRNVAINNDRDEVYDKLNVVVQSIAGDLKFSKDVWTVDIKIMDGTKEVGTKSFNGVTSDLQTFSIDVTKMNLKVNTYYKAVVTLSNSEESTHETKDYTFRKIDKTNRQFRIDEYGRTWYNDELFFPMGVYLMGINETDLALINKSHINFVMPYDEPTQEDMDLMHRTQGDNIRVLYTVNEIYNMNRKTCEISEQDKYYKKLISQINKFKDHPSLFSWYINDEIPACFNTDLRNHTLTIRELDPNHPTYSVIIAFNDAIDLINTTDTLQMDIYPIDIFKIKRVYEMQKKTRDNTLHVKAQWPVVQIMDWESYVKDNPSYEGQRPPTEQEIRHMSWQAFVGGATGILYYSYFDLVKMNHKTPVEERWKDIEKVTDEIWEYRHVILSIDEYDTIKYEENEHIALKQWKYKDINYVAIVNLEREEQTFSIDLNKNDYEVDETLGLGEMKRDKNKLTFTMKPIDVMIVRFSENALPDDPTGESSSSASSIMMTLFIVMLILIDLF